MCGRYLLIDVLEHEGVVFHHPLREHKMGAVGLQPGDGLFHALQRVTVVALALGRGHCHHVDTLPQQPLDHGAGQRVLGVIAQYSDDKTKLPYRFVSVRQLLN